MRRPDSFRDVAARTRNDVAGFDRHLAELLDGFYLSDDDEQRQACLDPVPEAVGDPVVDAWIGAAGELLALRWSLIVPSWTEHSVHFALDHDVYVPTNPLVAGILFDDSPPAFRRRRLYVSREPLGRATLPAERRAYFDPDERRREKEKSRECDEARLAAGESPAVIRDENGFFSALDRSEAMIIARRLRIRIT